MNTSDPLANTPVIVGVGQFVERIDAPDYRGLSPADLAAVACERACDDALNLDALRTHIDAIGTTRTFEDSGAGMPAPFGKANNFPRAIARRLGIQPRRAVWGKAGGDSPQVLLDRMCESVASGEIEMALLTGAEAISTVRHLRASGQSRDFSETSDEPVDDHGPGIAGLLRQYHMRYKLTAAPTAYALFEHARRRRLGLSREDYARHMGELFAPFTQVAANNPYSSSRQAPMAASELIRVDPDNRIIADPYPRRLVSRDQVNQSAAVLITSVAKARELGILESQWVYLHGYSEAAERDILERADLGASPAAHLALRAALGAADRDVSQIAHFDFYSCFPIAVSNAAIDGLGLAAEDRRGLTVTGGLPFFGGPGNNYSMHAIATMVERLRADPGSYGLVGANGGFLSKYAAGVYSTTPKPWSPCDSRSIQAAIDALPSPEVAREADGLATVETYTVVYEKGEPVLCIVIGRLEEDSRRFIAHSTEGDRSTLERAVEQDMLGARVYVRSTPRGNRFAFDETRVVELFPQVPARFRESYEYCLVERRDRVLEVTINRPEVFNCLHPMANEELASIFDAYLADQSLWIAIITGAGDKAFSTGNDLKYSASGKPVWTPKAGFGGLTSRKERAKPVIAAVNGYALGGGLEICLACDLVVADETAQFGLPEVRVGLIAGAGGVVRLPRQLPKKLAVELILTGKRLDARRALELGLVNRVVPAGAALEGARELAAEIAESCPTSVRLSMRAMQEAENHASEIGAVLQPSDVFDELFTSEDMFEGINAFAQHRKPQWKGR